MEIHVKKHITNSRVIDGFGRNTSRLTGRILYDDLREAE